MLKMQRDLVVVIIVVTWWWPGDRGWNMLSPCHLK